MYLEHDEDKPEKREENKGVKTHMREKIRKKSPQSGGECESWEGVKENKSGVD